MAIEAIRADKYTLVLSIRNDRADNAEICDLDEALATISDSLEDKSLFFRALDLSGEWRSGSGDFDPWNSDNLRAWAILSSRSTALPGLHKWLGEVENLLRRHLAEKYTPIWESGEVLFGEIPLSILAVSNLEFVPVYTNFIDVWGDINTQRQYSIVAEIVQTHGRCSEVENLLLKLVAYKGGDGDLIEYVLRSELEKLYGDFPKSELFRLMVMTMNARGSELQDSTGKRYIFNYMPSWPELTDAAQTILAELDAR